MAAEKSTRTRWCADCWERWVHTAWKHTDFLEWLWTSPKSAIFVQITAFHAWHLNKALFPAEKPWVYGLRMTIGMCLLLGSQLGMIITFFFVKRKCYRQLNVLSGWFEGGFLGKSPLFLSLLWFSFARSRLLQHQEAGGPSYFCFDGKPCKICIICFIEEAGEMSRLRIGRIRDYHSSVNLPQCPCIAMGNQGVWAV